MATTYCIATVSHYKLSSLFSNQQLVGTRVALHTVLQLTLFPRGRPRCIIRAIVVRIAYGILYTRSSVLLQTPFLICLHFLAATVLHLSARPLHPYPSLRSHYLVAQRLKPDLVGQ